MKPKFSKIFSINKYSIILLLTMIIYGCGSKNSTANNNPLEGKWRSLAVNSMEFTLTFDENNHYTTEVQSKDVQFTVKGKYAIHGDTLFIRDTLNTPIVLCNYTDTGSYVFKKNKDTILFKPIVDNCEKRKISFEIGLVKLK